MDSICGEGTAISDMMCVVSMAVGGYFLEVDKYALIVAGIGVDPVITGLVALTIAGVAGQVAWFIHRRKKKILNS